MAALAQAPIPVVAPPPGAQGLTFLPNKGQWDARARFAADIPDGRLFLTDQGLTYAFVKGLPKHPATAAPEPLRACGLQVNFINARLQPVIKGEAPNGDRRNYFHGSDPRRWAARVPGYARTHYTALWPGIDLTLYQNPAQRLEYDFLLAPHADPAQVALRYAGADKMTLDPNGNLQVQTPLGRLTELAPRAYTTDAAGHRREVSCRYQLAESTVRFALGAYDKTLPLTIDPTVIFSSFTGSTADNWGFTATYDAQGNLYSGGIVFGLGYPTSVGAYNPVFNGLTTPGGGVLDCDMAFIKYNPNTTGPAARVWATYLGGNSSEFPHSIVTNARGELVILGTTSSPNFPTSAGAYQRTFAGGPTTSPYSPPPTVPGGMPPFTYGPPYNLPNGSDLVLARLSAQGDSLLASTFLGGSANDGLLSVQSPQPRLCHNYGDYFRGDVLLDAQDNVYIATTTNSANFPTANSFGSTYRGGATDAVVASLSPRLTTLRFSALLGGSGADAAYSLQRDGAGRIFVAGGTTSPNFPVTAGCLQPALGGDVDGFVVQLSASGSTLNRATYLGTAAYDQAYFLQLDTGGEPYLLGQTRGRIPISTGRYGNAGAAQYVQKLSARLDSLRFSTVFGSAPDSINISPTAFLVDQCDRVYVSGWGGGENQNSRFGFANSSVLRLPITANAVQPTTDGADFYLAQFGPEMNRLQYATYLGNNGGEGDHVDGGTCRFDPRGFVYHAVCSCGQNLAGGAFPIPPGANTYSATKGNFNCNNAAFKINFGTVPITTGTDSVVCALAGPVRLGGRPVGGTWTGPGVSGNPTAGYFFAPSVALIGFQTLTYTVIGDSVCGISAPLRLRVAAVPVVSFAPLPQTTYCRGRTALTVPLVATPAGGVFSGPGVSGAGFSPQAAGPGLYTLTYTYNAPRLTCPVVATRTVTVVDSITVSIPADTLVCVADAPLRLRAQPTGGVWTGPGVTGTATSGFTFAPTGLTGPNALTYTAPGLLQCAGVATRTVTVAPLPVVSLAPLPQTTYCRGRTALTVPLTGTPAGGVFSGPGVSGSTFDPVAAGPGQHLIAYTYRTTPGPTCAVTATRPVTVRDSILVRLPADTLLCVAGAPLPLLAQPPGGTWAGPGVTGTPATGFAFAPAGLNGPQALTYTAPGTTVCGGVAVRTIRVAPLPVVSLASLPQSRYCRGRTATSVPLTGSPVGGVFSGPGVSGGLFDPIAAGPGQHTIAYTYSAPGLPGCPVVATRPVTVVDSIVLRMPADTIVCEFAGPIRLVARPGGGSWAGPGVAGSVAAGFTFAAAGLSGPQLVTYTAPNAGPCGGVAGRIIQVVPIVQAVIQPLPQANTYCPSGAPLTLVGSPAGGTFSGVGVRSGNIFDPGIAGVGLHTITYTYVPALGNCPAVATVQATVLPVVVALRQADTTVCVVGSPVGLGGSPAGGTWSGPGVSGSASAGYLFTPSASLLGAQTLTYVAPGANMCGGTVVRRFTVAPVVPAGIAAAGLVHCPDGPPVALVGSPAGGTFSGPGIVNNEFVPRLANPGPNLITYRYVPPGPGCSSLATLTLTVAPVLPVVLPPDTMLCPGTTALVRLRATPPGGTWAGPGVRGSLAGGFVFDAGSLVRNSIALTYTPPATSCAVPASFRVGIAPVPAFQPGSTAPRCPDVQAAPRQILFTEALGSATTRWDFGDGTPPETGASVLHTYTQPGTYRPVATLPYGPGSACALSQPLLPVEVLPLFLPNIITPNGDGVNDAFKPRFACLPHLKILTRWGQLIYDNPAYANDWDAPNQPAGTYYYLLEDSTGQRQRGWLEVVK